MSSQLSKNFLTELLNEQGTKTVKSYAVNASEWLEERKNDLSIYAANPLIKEMNWEKIKNYLKEEQIKQQDKYLLFFIADTKGNYHTTTGDTGNINDRGYFQQVMEARKVVSSPLVSRATGKNIIVVAAPIKNKAGQVTGLMGATIQLKTLSNFVNKLKMDYNDSNSFIVDEEGWYITCPLNKYIMKENITIESDIIKAKLARMGRDILDNEKGYFKYQDNRHAYLIYYHQIPGNNKWKFVTRVPEIFILDYVQKASERLGVISLIGILVALLFSLIISRNMSRPIIKLKELFIQATDGDLEVRSDIERNDEIGQAADAFNKMMEQITELTYYDKQTGLPNRTYLDNTFQVVLNHCQVNQEIFAVITMSIDQYHDIVDSFGHDIGDKLLSLVAGELNSISPELRVFSGVETEFVLLLTEIDQVTDIIQFINKLNIIINKTWQIDEHHIYISTSIGITLFPENGKDKESLLKNSSLALHRTRSTPGSNYQFYDPDMNQNLIEEISLENDLRVALDKNQFILYYQPLYRTDAREIIGLEALVRWQHPEYGLITPGKFIKIAEESGIILDLGRWVLKEACQQNIEWQKKGVRPLKIGVNVAPLQLLQEDFVEMIIGILENTGLKSSYLELEITERAMVNDNKKTIKLLNELKELGIQVSIDDFGTGYSSLQYLKDFALNNLKIDMSFIRDMFVKEDNTEIVRAINAMGHSLNLTVTAEGVENERQYEFLKGIGCDYIQGYYFSKPLPAKEVKKLF